MSLRPSPPNPKHSIRLISRDRRADDHCAVGGEVVVQAGVWDDQFAGGVVGGALVADGLLAFVVDR